jgi:hypothetical protein
MLNPSLTLDFTTATLNPRITFARSGNTATVINSSGLVSVVNANIPRFDYDPLTLACRGLLIEETRTNLLIESSAFDNAAWVKSNLNTTGTPPYINVAVSPSGATNADFMIESATNAQHNVRLSANMAAATTHTYSFFVKAAGRINITMNRFNSAVVPSFAHTFTLSGAGTSSGGVITALANDWYRCSGSFTTTGAGVGGFVILLSDGTGTTYLGNGTSGVYIWGAQLEAGSSVTSYIPTTTVAVARNPDIATITGTSFSGFWRVGIGSALASVRPYVASGTRPVVQFDDNTANNIIALRGNVANPELYIRTGGSDQAQIDAGTISANVLYRLAGAWATNDCAASVNSGTPALDGSANIPVVTQARLGSDGTNYLNGHLEAIQYYTTRMLSASLQVVSSTAGYRSIINPVFADTIIS